MKKFTLSLVFAVLCTGGLFAQRTADVEVSEIVSPDTVFAGKNFQLHYIITNNGPDDLMAGDTVFYWAQFANISTGQPGSIAPIALINKTMTIGDTFNIKVSFNPLSIATSFDAKTTVISEVLNRNPTTGLNRETQATGANNQMIIDTHFKGWGAGVEGVSVYKLTTSAYPNPAKNDVNVSFVAAGGADYTINIMDINGKLVQSTNGTTTNGTNNVNMNVSELPAGVYMYQLNMDNATSTNKLIITK